MSTLDKRVDAVIEERELTDAGNAERFAAQHGENVCYVVEWGWMAWDGKRWARDELVVRDRMMKTARNIYAEAANVADTEAQKEVVKWAKQSQRAQRISAALWCAQPSLAVSAEEFDKEPLLLPVANGTIDLRTGDLHPYRREHKLTRASPVIFDDSATCPTWHAYLERVLPDSDLRAFVQKAVGYSLTGNVDEQVLFFLYGGGRNGKSVFLETVSELVGDYHKATRMDSLSSAHRGGIPNDIAALAGARMVTVSETPDNARLNEPLVKDLTGGDTIAARFLRHEFFQFRPQFKLWIRGNHKPTIRGTDDGIWRRVLLVPFQVQIPESDVDPSLPEKLRDELPGILNWAVDGCRAWQAEGLKPPSHVTDAVREYRSEMDTLGEFIADACVIQDNATATAKELYGAYGKWCDANGHHPVSSTKFGLALGERGFIKQKSQTVQWHGIGLLATQEPI